MTLLEIKRRIKAVSSDEELNKLTMIAISKDSDCFGDQENGYNEEDIQCQKCNILMELDERRENLYVFCKEFSTKAYTAKSENIQEEKKMTTEVKAEETKEEKKEVKKESRPKMMARKKVEGLSLEQCLEDAELLAKYDNKKAWIKADFAK